MNGRIDLSQAEAVIDIIQSKNEYALKSSVGQLKGNVKQKIVDIREKILYHTAFIETALVIRAHQCRRVWRDTSWCNRTFDKGDSKVDRFFGRWAYY